MPKYQSPALDKGLDILEYLSVHSVPQSQTEIANGLNRKSNEIYRMLICLEERAYINKDRSSGKFSLSLKLFYLSRKHSIVNSLREAARYPMAELSEFSKQSCHLSILYKNKVLVIAQSLSAGPISLSIEEGAKFSLFGTTSGRIILSQLSHDERLIYLNQDEGFCGLSKKQKEEYLMEIDEISTIRSHIRKSETTDGVTDIGVTFGIPQVDIIGALAVSILSSQIEKSTTNKKILAASFAAAEKIYQHLGVSN